MPCLRRWVNRAAGGRGAAVTAGIISPAVLEWAERVKPGARVASCTVRPLSGGNVARHVEQVTLHLAGSHDPLELVRKEAPAHEIAGLRAAQALRPEATAISELVAWGADWLITPLAPGAPLSWGDAVPANLFDTLAALHARYHRGSSRIGPAALDLANLVRADSAEAARYAATWRELTGQPLPADVVDPGYRWAALQIPSSTCPGRSRTGPPATSKPHWTGSNRR
jgi:hypothetical protein